MKKILIVFPALLLFLLWYFYPNPVFYSPPISNDDLLIDSTLTMIEKDIIDLTSIGDLVSNENFIQLCSFAQSNVSQFFMFLESELVTEQRKIILIMAAHTLPKEKFIEFFNHGCNLYVENKLNKNELLYLLVPGNDWNNRTLIYFYQPKMRLGLKNVRDSKKNNHEIEKITEDILSGKLAFLLYFQ